MVWENSWHDYFRAGRSLLIRASQKNLDADTNRNNHLCLDAHSRASPGGMAHPMVRNKQQRRVGECVARWRCILYHQSFAEGNSLMFLIIDTLFQVYTWGLIAYCVLDFFPQQGARQFKLSLVPFYEPFLTPIRSLVKPISNGWTALDLSPVVLLFIINILHWLAYRLFQM